MAEYKTRFMLSRNEVAITRDGYYYKGFPANPEGFEAAERELAELRAAEAASAETEGGNGND